MIDSQRYLFDELSALGVGDFVHLNGSLTTHLVAVYDILKLWGADDGLRRAGLYHAAYGTAGFDQAMVSLDRRSEIASLIGVDAEAIVYAYCACDRRVVWPRIGVEKVVQFRDRFTGGNHVIEGRPLRAFCELSCANELELAYSDPAFVGRTGAYLAPLFRQWSPFLSQAAIGALEQIYPVA
jgi:hypothetical protein